MDGSMILAVFVLFLFLNSSFPIQAVVTLSIEMNQEESSANCLSIIDYWSVLSLSTCVCAGAWLNMLVEGNHLCQAFESIFSVCTFSTVAMCVSACVSRIIRVDKKS